MIVAELLTYLSTLDPRMEVAVERHSTSWVPECGACILQPKDLELVNPVPDRYYHHEPKARYLRIS